LFGVEFEGVGVRAHDEFTGAERLARGREKESPVGGFSGRQFGLDERYG
jgi:hypothetical protein